MDLNSIKNVIRSILVSSAYDISVFNLQKDYQSFEGNSIPYKEFGFNSINAFLHTLTDTLVLKGHGTNAMCSAVSTESNQHIARLVSVQRKPTRTHRRSSQRFYDSRPRYHEKNFGRDDRNGFYRSSIADRTWGGWERNRYCWRSSTNNIECTQSGNASLPKPSTLNVPVPFENRPHSTEPPKPTVEQFDPPQPEKQTSIFDKALSSLAEKETTVEQFDPPVPVKQSLSNEEKKVSALDKLKTKFATAETKEYPEKQPLKTALRYGPAGMRIETPVAKNCKPKPANSRIVPDVFAEEKESNWDETSEYDQNKTFAGYTHKSPNTETFVPGPDFSSSSDDSLSKKLMPLRMEVAYKELQSGISYVAFTFTLPYLFIRKLSDTTTDHDLFDTTDSAIPNIDAFDPISMLGVAEGVASVYHQIPDADISDHVKDLDLNEFILVFVAEFYSPHRFWFHFHTNCNQFDDMMDRLNDFYRTVTDAELNMGYCNIQQGQICVARFDDHWSRAEILGGVDSKNCVQINYVDYNTVRTVPLGHLKFMMHEFSVMPKQAFRGCLNSILPKTWTSKNQLQRSWHLGATEIMVAHMSTVVHCKIMHIDYEAKITYMECVDTVTSIDEEYVVNDVLCNKNYAYYDYGLERVKDHGEYVHIRNHYDKYYSKIEPTFEQLEMGKEPSYTELMEFGRLLVKIN
jgi:Tudor domain/OST-HTH/LOTUS domain